MDVQFNEDLLVKLYIDVDELRLGYMSYLRSIGQHDKAKQPKTNLNGSEVATILISYHLSGYKCFEYFYRRMVKHQLAKDFPKAPLYETFLAYIPKAEPLVFLWLLHTTLQSKRTGLYFIDSKKLQVCHLKREHSNRVFKGVAAKGKTSTGWFFGLKIHLITNNLGQIVSFRLTSGNVADNNHALLQELLEGLHGICCGDKGYHSKLFKHFFELDLRLLCKPKRNVKKKLPIENQYNLIINKRAVIESTFDILGTVCDIEHSRHRSPLNATVHILASLVAYQYLENKPSVFFPSRKNTLKKAA